MNMIGFISTGARRPLIHDLCRFPWRAVVSNIAAIRIFQFSLHLRDPLFQLDDLSERREIGGIGRPGARVLSLSIFVEGDDSPVKTLNEIHQPDNIETTPNGILSHGGPGLEPAVPGRIAAAERDDRAPLARRLATRRARQVAAKVDQSADGGADRRRRRAGRQLGAHGRRAASSTRRPPSGPDMFLVTVQAHTLWVEQGAGRRQQRRRPARTSRTSARAGSSCCSACRARRRREVEVGQASGPDPPSSRVTKPGPPANRQWSMFITLPSA